MKNLFLGLLLFNLACFGQILDENFNSGGSGPGMTAVRESIVLDNGKILIIGGFSTFNGINREGIALLNQDGSLDLSFDLGEGPSNGDISSTITAIAIQSDGKILVGGQFSSINGHTTKCVARLHSNGSVDTSFSTGETFNFSEMSDIYISDIIIKEENQILVGGQFSVYNSLNDTFGPNHLVCFTDNGSINTSYSLQGLNLNLDDRINVMALQNDGKLLFSSLLGRPKRLNPQGGPDVDFNLNTQYISVGTTFALLCLPDNNILAWARFSGGPGPAIHTLGRINYDGTLDTTFELHPTTSTGTFHVAHSIELFNGKYLIAGQFNSYGSHSIEDLALINTDGSLDTTFNIGPVYYSIPANSHLFDATVHGNSIYVSGSFNYIDNHLVFGIAKINNTDLGIEDNSHSKDVFAITDTQIQVVSNYQDISKIKVYNVLGELLIASDSVNATIWNSSSLEPSGAILIINVTTIDGKCYNLKTIW